MILTELVFLLILTSVNAIVGRCYLCSEETLAECVGSNQSDSSIYINVLQYYTEPCNGQCVLFRNENHLIIRGCSWTYGHMTPKSTGWHEISPGIKAYFCDSYLCNNGTYEQIMKTEFRLSPQQLFLLAENNPLQLQFGISRQLRQCYSCTARFQGCSEFLDPHYASKYIRACPTSCIIFRNPNDLNVITRDCSLFWPQVYAKTGLHKLFGTDAFFCQESLCNGISFDFIMGIFHNQLPAVITFPPIHASENTTTTNDDVQLETTTLVISNNSTDSFEKILPVSIESGNSTLNASNWNDTFLSTIVTSTVQLDDRISNSTDLITTFENLSADDNSELNFDMDEDYILSSSTSIIDFLPYYFLNNNQTENQLFEYIKPLAIPPFSWMLNMATQNKSRSTTTTEIPHISYEYCKNKQCHYGGRLNSDCLCICLPTFTGDNCETVLCEDEPGDICAFILEHECQTNTIRYLCPKFCQLDICLSNQT